MYRCFVFKHKWEKEDSPFYSQHVRLNFIAQHKEDGSLRRNVEGKRLMAIGNCSVWRGPSSHSERPVESEVGHTGPTPKDRFSLGSQACIVPRPL